MSNAHTFTWDVTRYAATKSMIDAGEANLQTLVSATGVNMRQEPNGSSHTLKGYATVDGTHAILNAYVKFYKVTSKSGKRKDVRVNIQTNGFRFRRHAMAQSSTKFVFKYVPSDDAA